MTAAGQLSYPPVAIRLRPAVRQYSLSRRQSGTLTSWPHRVHRLPPRKRQQALAYGWNGYAELSPERGTVIDLYA